LKQFFLIVFISSFFSIFGQEKKIETGEIIDSISVGTTSDESYALYLPRAYDPNELSSIIFIFDPAARGKIGIHPFIKAAEKYNYILICSNNSRNGPNDKNTEITTRLLSKIISEFNINPKRIYTAGFSGGARFASRVAVLSDQIQGVIACGAGISSNQVLFHSGIKFSYAAIVGDQDMNLLEMYGIRDYITKFKVSNELFVYEMNHRWPSQEQILEAVDWLQLEALKKGLAKKDDEKIRDLYINSYTKARALESKMQLVSAQEEYQRIIKNFNLYFQLDSIKEKQNDLRKNKTLIKEKKELKAIFEREASLSQKYFDRFYLDLAKTDPKLKWWASEIRKLQKEEKTAESNQKKMLYRLLYKIFAIAIEEVNVGEVKKNSDQAIFCYDICKLVYPEYNPR